MIGRFLRKPSQGEDQEFSNQQRLLEFMSTIIEDPALSPVLLPEDWPRPAAQSLNLKLRQLLAEPAGHFFDEIYQTSAALVG